MGLYPRGATCQCTVCEERYDSIDGRQRDDDSFDFEFPTGLRLR